MYKFFRPENQKVANLLPIFIWFVVSSKPRFCFFLILSTYWTIVIRYWFQHFICIYGALFSIAQGHKFWVSNNYQFSYCCTKQRYLLTIAPRWGSRVKSFYYFMCSKTKKCYLHSSIVLQKWAYLFSQDLFNLCIEAMLRELEVVTEFIIGGHSLNKVRWADDGKHRKKNSRKTETKKVRR